MVLGRIFLFSWLLTLVGPALAADALALVTVVDGEAVLLRHTTLYALKPGTPLHAHDVIETNAKTALVRVEFADALVTDLGPQTRVMLAPKLTGAAKARSGALYVLGGWVKISASLGKPSQTAVLSDGADVSGVTGGTVLSSQAHSTDLFAETGAAVVTPRLKGQATAAVTLKPGSHWSRSGTDKAAVSARPPASFLQGVPRAFLDPIPLRAGVFKGRPEPALKALGDLGYDQALPWLNAEAPLRALLPGLWKAQLGAELRTGLMQHIKAHPEWDRTLFPEKYLPAQAASAASAVPAPVR